MARTFVRVELVERDGEHAAGAAGDGRFSTAMDEAGFVRTVRGRTSGKAMLLPSGMYLIVKKTALEALGMAQEAARSANVEARIFCVSAGGGVRCGNLLSDDHAPVANA